MILCGGRGTRLQQSVSSIPKPLVEIGGHPIVWHVIQIYAAQGFDRFLLLTGYKSNLIEDFVAAESWPDGVSVEPVFTGEDTPTGGRVHNAAEHLRDGTFKPRHHPQNPELAMRCRSSITISANRDAGSYWRQRKPL